MTRKYLTRVQEGQIRERTLALCEIHLPATVTPVVRFNYSPVMLGSAIFGVFMYRKPQIVYSRPLMSRTTEADRVETIYHEVSHLIVFYSFAASFMSRPNGWLAQSLEKEGDHGPLFRQFMRGFGYDNPGGCGRSFYAQSEAR